jgi:S-DNA-T family DNA segregation ATPase FtsK/SpoIIIE
MTNRLAGLPPPGQAAGEGWAGLLADSEAAHRKIDSAISAAEQKGADLEEERGEFQAFLKAQGERFTERRNIAMRHPKLGRHTRLSGSYVTDRSALTDRAELEAVLDEFFRAAGEHWKKALANPFTELGAPFFKKKPVTASIRLIDEALSLIEKCDEALPEAFDERRRKLNEELRVEIESLRRPIDAWLTELAETSAEWDSEGWAEWAPPSAIFPVVRFGVSAQRQSPVGLVDGGSQWLLSSGRPLFIWDQPPDVVAQVQSLILRILAQFPPGMARFVFVDPLGAGKSVAPFLHLADYDEGLVGGKVWSESVHIEQRLSELQSHIEMVVQKYLRGQFADIESHNRAAGEIAEAYRFLIVFDFPAGFSDVVARRLVSIARNGPACGVYAIVIGAPGREMPHGFDGSELGDATALFTPKGELGGLREITGPETLSPWRAKIERPPELKLTEPGEPQNLFSRVIAGIGSNAKAATSVEVSEGRLLELLDSTLVAGLTEHQPIVERAPRLEEPQSWWAGDAAQGIAAPVGRVGARTVQSLALVGTDTSVHALIAGKTGSGKSTLLHAIILNLCLLYSPDELELYLVDFKQGVEFKPYASSQLAHARVVAIESEREFGLSVLRGLEGEIARRGELFRDEGVDDLSDYRRTTKGKMPRILLVADEFHVLFSDDDAIANEAARILDRLVRQGRSFGVHVILASQTISGVHQIGRGTMNQIAVRIALQCSESDSQVIFGEDNPDARMLSRPGEAIYNSMNGMPEGNRRFQVVLLKDEERGELLERLRAHATESGYEQAPVVFEGNAQADPEDNPHLQALLDNAAGEPAPKSPRSWLGAPISLDGPVAVVFERRAGANLLLTGTDGEAVDGILLGTLLGLAPQLGAVSAELAPIELLDFGGLDEPFATTVNELAALDPTLVRVGRRRQVATVLERVGSELESRIESPDLSPPPLFLVLHRLQSARDFDPSAFEDDSADPAAVLGAILREGPEFGIHAIVSCDTPTNLERRLEPTAQREFGLRVVSRMSERDSLQMIDVADAAKLAGAQAIFSDEDRSQLIKLRGFGLPRPGWVATWAERPGWQARSDRGAAGAAVLGGPDGST